MAFLAKRYAEPSFDGLSPEVRISASASEGQVETGIAQPRAPTANGIGPAFDSTHFDRALRVLDKASLEHVALRDRLSILQSKYDASAADIGMYKQMHRDASDKNVAMEKELIDLRQQVILLNARENEYNEKYDKILSAISSAFGDRSSGRALMENLAKGSFGPSERLG